jgi:two-component system response regulator YesN
MSVGAYISDLRMKHARKLLSTTTYSITDTAKRCGFEDVYYFSNFFKKFHGSSPTEYRKQNL